MELEALSDKPGLALPGLVFLAGPGLPLTFRERAPLASNEPPVT